MLIIAGINTGTSIYAGLAIFSVLGYMAKEQGVHISNVTDKGKGVVYNYVLCNIPEAVHIEAMLT